MRWALGAMAVLCVFTASTVSAKLPPSKLALVIGNADYDRNGEIETSAVAVKAASQAGFVNDLHNTLNDAADIRDALQSVGFQVEYLENGDRSMMQAAFARFADVARHAHGKAVIVIYYAGHAIGIGGENYLIPVGARLPVADGNVALLGGGPALEAFLKDVALPVSALLQEFERVHAPATRLFIFDSCRNNPWSDRFQLAHVFSLSFDYLTLMTDAIQRKAISEGPAYQRVDGPVLAYSTGKGAVAFDGGDNVRNSPYATALKANIVLPGFTVEQMLGAVARDVSGTTGDAQQPFARTIVSSGVGCIVSCPQLAR